MKIWLDDCFDPPSNDWIWCKDIVSALSYIKSNKVETISFDFNLEFDTGLDLLIIMINQGLWTTNKPTVHSY